MYLESGNLVWKAGGTKPENAGRTGVMPKPLILSRMLCCKPRVNLCQPSGKGPPNEFMLPIRCQGRKAGPAKKSLKSFSVIPNWIKIAL